MEFAIQTRGPWDATLAAAKWAEDRDLAAFAMPDHYLRRGDDPEAEAFDHLTHLAALAAVTSGIELVSLVSPVTFRHPAVLHKILVTIDDISKGRFVLGVGTGWLGEEFQLFGLPFPDEAVRYEMLEECLAYLQAAARPGPTGFQGDHYQLADFDPHPHPSNGKLLVGGSGKLKTPRLAGRYADEYNIYACRPDEFTRKAEVAHEAAEQAGRDPETLFVSATGPAIAAIETADYQRMLNRMADLTGNDPQHIEAAYQERGWPHGPGTKAAEMIASLEEVGCQRYYLQMFGAVDTSDFETTLTAFGG